MIDEALRSIIQSKDAMMQSKDAEMTQKVDQFVATCCIVRPDVEEESVNLAGRFRLWSHTKPTKETFRALKHYMDVKFKPKRIERIHGYQGIKLKTVEYNKVIATEAENPAQLQVLRHLYSSAVNSPTVVKS